MLEIGLGILPSVMHCFERSTDGIPDASKSVPCCNCRRERDYVTAGQSTKSLRSSRNVVSSDNWHQLMLMLRTHAVGFTTGWKTTGARISWRDGESS